MATEWISKDVFLSDLWSYSEIEQPSCEDEDIPTPTTIQEYHTMIGANNNPSIFENPFQFEEAPLVSSGRGRGARNVLITPGVGVVPKPDANLHVDELTRRKLRQVTGLGYSNELIEQSFKVATNKFNGVTKPEIKLQPVPSTSSASNRSSPSCVSKVHSPSSSKRSSANVTPNRSMVSTSNTSACSSRSSTPPLVEEAQPLEVVKEIPPSNPLPLSVMRSRAKQKNMQEDPNKVKEDLNKTKENPKKEKDDPKKDEKPAIVENGESRPNRSFELNVDAPEWTPNGNDYWWNRSAEVTNNEPNSWRRRDTNSPNRYFAWKPEWNQKSFNIASSKDFPALK